MVDSSPSVMIRVVTYKTEMLVCQQKTRADPVTHVRSDSDRL
jgi:hypothetical protein